MSLKSQLNDKESPVSRWMEANVNRRAGTEFVVEVNDQLATRHALTVPGNTHYTLVGAAFDYCFRWLLGPLDPTVVAVSGARLCAALLNWTDALAVAREIIREGNASVANTERRVKCAIALSWFEAVFRSKKIPPEIDAISGRPASGLTLDLLYSKTPEFAVEDIMQLVASVPRVWGIDIQQRFILNPTFSGSTDVVGADADWISQGTLYECKVSKQSRPFERYALLQVLGYVLLDYNDRYSIHSVGWYYARQEMRLVFPLAALLPRLFATSDLRALRQSFSANLQAENQQVSESQELEIIDVSKAALIRLVTEETHRGKRVRLKRTVDNGMLYLIRTAEGRLKCYRIRPSHRSSR